MFALLSNHNVVLYSARTSTDASVSVGLPSEISPLVLSAVTAALGHKSQKRTRGSLRSSPPHTCLSQADQVVPAVCLFVCFVCLSAGLPQAGKRERNADWNSTKFSGRRGREPRRKPAGSGFAFETKSDASFFNSRQREPLEFFFLPQTVQLLFFHLLMIFI